jgi:hypothetical protein
VATIASAIPTVSFHHKFQLFFFFLRWDAGWLTRNIIAK